MRRAEREFIGRGRNARVAQPGLILGQVGGVAVLGPVNTVAPVISGTAAVGQVLSTTNGTWIGAPTITFAYQWQRDGNAISGATSNTYTVQSADQGTAITCRVTATNPEGSRAATSNTINIPAASVGAFSSGFSSGFSIAA